jgi:hypothetical protein
MMPNAMTTDISRPPSAAAGPGAPLRPPRQTPDHDQENQRNQQCDTDHHHGVDALGAKRRSAGECRR